MASNRSQSPVDSDTVWESIEFKKLPTHKFAQPTSTTSTIYGATSAPSCFKYSPLDHQVRSIRLVRLRPEKTPEGRIQCELRHASIDDTYVCLSYVWGESDQGQWITINEMPFWVGQNLFDFLQSARRKRRFRTQWLWIDALSIDQTTVAERNHQVQQMGQIYAGAKGVISWLGYKKRIANFLLHVAQGGFDPEGYSNFCNSKYWDRAWITQEVVLARRIKFMAKNAELKGELIPFSNDQICQLRILNLHPQTLPEVKGRSLIYLLDKFRLKKCGTTRDRVFSLLALCGHGSDLKVDYATPPIELAQNILRACNLSFCLCSVGVVGNVLNLNQHMGEAVGQSIPSSPSFAQLRLPTIPNHSELPLYYCLPCSYVGCDGSDWSHLYNVRSRTAQETILSVTLDLRYFCNTYRGLVTFNVNSAMEACDISYNPNHNFRPDRHIIQPKPGEDLCIIQVPFHLLFELSQVPQFASRCCERIVSQGTSSAEHLIKECFLHLTPETHDV
jgi:hypothetical protein